MPVTYISTGPITCHVASDEPLPPWAWQHIAKLSHAVDEAARNLSLAPKKATPRKPVGSKAKDG